MKHFIAISLFCLMTVSFLGDAGVLSFQEKPKIESSQDIDGEEDVNEKVQKQKFAFFQSSTPTEDFITVIKANTLLTTRLFRFSCEVETRPPQA